MAKQILCKTCGKKISKNAKICPHCGEHYTRYSLWQKIKYSILGIFVFLFAVGFLSNPDMFDVSPPTTIEKSGKIVQIVKPTKDEIKAKEALKSKVKNILIKEPKIKDVLWSSDNILQIGIFDDGTNRNGYAEYICLVLNENGFENQRTMVQLIDIVKLTQTGQYTELGKTFCNRRKR